MKFIKKTKSYCPECLAEIEADIVEENGKIILKKKCTKHGKFEFFHAWDDPEVYYKMNDIFSNVYRKMEEAAIDVTFRCNMRCPFCFCHAGNWQEEDPSIDEIMKKIVNLKDEMLILYGGEPTMRDDLFDLIKRIKKSRLKVGMLTNGLKLDEDYMKKLKILGIDKLQIILDSLDDDESKIIRGIKISDKAIETVKLANKLNMKLNLFSLIVKNVNENQVEKLMNFASRNKSIKGLIISTLCPEGKKCSLKPLKSSELMDLMKKFGITKGDFLDCTEFDVLFLEKIKFLKRKKLSMCDAICHIYRKQLKPINRLFDIKKVNKILKNDNGLLMYLKLFFLFSYNFFKNPKLLTDMIFNRFNSFFGLIITTFQDRYNADFDMFKNCTIYNYFNADFICFCKKNILMQKYYISQISK